MSRLQVLLLLLGLISAQADDLTKLKTLLNTYECEQTLLQFYAKVDGVLSNFNSLTNAQQVSQFLALGNQYLTSNVVVTINAPTGRLVANGITEFAYLVGAIAQVDCGEHHVFGSAVTNSSSHNNVTLWFNEVSFANASPSSFCAGALNGTASVIPGRFEVTCTRSSDIAPWLLSDIVQSFRGTLMTPYYWLPGWLAVNLPDATYP
jgi:hypothetical protein